MSNPCANSNDFLNVKIGNNTDESLNFGIAVSENPCDAAEIVEEAPSTQEELDTPVEPDAPDEPAEPDVPEEQAAATTFYSCNGARATDLMDNSGAKQVNLAFDYEIVTTQDADVTSSVEWLESDLLTAVAEEFGLRSCGDSGRRRSLLRTNHGGRVKIRELGDAVVLGVSSDPSDEADSLYGECTSGVESVASLKCTPINGFMTAWVSAESSNQRHLSESDILNAIEKYISTNTEYDSDKVVGVSYIGSRSENNNGEIDVVRESTISESNFVAQDEAEPSGLPVGIVVLIVAVAFLVGLAGTAFVVRRKRRNRAAKCVESQSAEELAGVGDSTNADTTEHTLKEVDEEESMKPVAVEEDASVLTEDYTAEEGSFEQCSTFESEDSSVVSSVESQPASHSEEEEGIEVPFNC